MKKFLIAALALVMSGSAFAIDNEPEEGLTQKVYAGMTIGTWRGAPGAGSKVGYAAGWQAEYMLPGAAGTYVNGGLELSMLGAKQGEKVRTHYLSLPIHVGYRYNILDNLGVYADFGPYFAFGMGGKGVDSDVKVFKKVSKGGMGAKRGDIGLGFRIGTEYNDKLSLTAGFNWGLTEMWDEVKNYNTTITLGYRF